MLQFDAVYFYIDDDERQQRNIHGDVPKVGNAQLLLKNLKIAGGRQFDSGWGHGQTSLDAASIAQLVSEHQFHREYWYFCCSREPTTRGRRFAHVSCSKPDLVTS